MRNVIRNSCTVLPNLGRDKPLLKPETHLVPITNIPVSRGVIGQTELLKTFRHTSAATIKELYEFLKINYDDDTKSFEEITLLFEDILLYQGYDNSRLKKLSQSNKSIRMMLDDTLAGKQKQLRSVQARRLYLQHSCRTMAGNIIPYTEIHDMYVKILVELSMNKYTVIRKIAQPAVKRCLAHMPFSGLFFMKDIAAYLKPSEGITHEQLKGAIFLLSIPAITNYLTSRPDICCELLPLLCRIQYSEKDSIINAIEHLVDVILDGYRTIQFNTVIPQAATELAVKISEALPAEKVQQGQLASSTNEKLLMDSHQKLVSRLLDVMNDPQTTWRFLDITGDLLRVMIRRDYPLDPNFVSCFLDNLVHDSLGMRNISLRFVTIKN